jgi:hypothetical protein
MVRAGQVAMTRGVNDGVRRVPGVTANRYQEEMEVATMTP